jgi:hypothetical protein
MQAWHGAHGGEGWGDRAACCARLDSTRLFKTRTEGERAKGHDNWHVQPGQQLYHRAATVPAGHLASVAGGWVALCRRRRRRRWCAPPPGCGNFLAAAGAAADVTQSSVRATQQSSALLLTRCVVVLLTA